MIQKGAVLSLPLVGKLNLGRKAPPRRGRERGGPLYARKALHAANVGCCNQRHTHFAMEGGPFSHQLVPRREGMLAEMWSCLIDMRVAAHEARWLGGFFFSFISATR